MISLRRIATYFLMIASIGLFAVYALLFEKREQKPSVASLTPAQCIDTGREEQQPHVFFVGCGGFF